MKKLKAPERDEIEESEIIRVKALNELMLDFQELGKQIQPLVNLAGSLTGAKWSLLNILDQSNQWTITSSEKFLYGVPKEKSVCQYTIKKKTPLEIKNLRDDERFQNNSLIINNKHIKYYYGIPFSVDGINNIGSLCFLSPNEITIDSILKETLQSIVYQMVEIFKLHSEKNRLRQLINDYKRQMDITIHDVRNQITVIHGSSELLGELNSINTTTNGINLLESIQKSSKSVKEQVMYCRNMLRSGLKFDLVSLTDLKEKLYQYFGDQAEISGVSLSINVQDSGNRVYVKIPLFMQLVGNFITNSIKFTPDGKSVTVDLKLVNAINSEKHDDFLLISTIIDDGVGMEEEDLKAIRSQTSPTPKSGQRGEMSNGTGMHVIYDSLAKMGGTFEIDSELNKGTKAVVTLPCSSKED